MTLGYDKMFYNDQTPRAALYDGQAGTNNLLALRI